LLDLKDLGDELSASFGLVVDDLGHFFEKHRSTTWVNAFPAVITGHGTTSSCTFAFGIDAQSSNLIFGGTDKIRDGFS